MLGRRPLLRAPRARPPSLICCSGLNKRQLLVGTAGVAAAGGAASRPALAKPKQDGRAGETLPPIPTLQLEGGLVVSKIIKGCWQLDGDHHGEVETDRTSGAEALEDMERFYLGGVTTFDTADNYGPSETLLGQWRRLYPHHSRSVVATKLSFMAPGGGGGGGAGRGGVSRDMVEYRLRASAARLGTPCLDLVHLHWEPGWGQAGWRDAAQALEWARSVGLIRAWGVANFDSPRLLQLLDMGLRPASVQAQYSLIDRRPDLFLAAACERAGIPLLAYGCLGGGFLAQRFRGLPAADARLDTLSKVRCGTLLRELGGWAWLQELLEVMSLIADKHGVSLSNVACKWVLQQPGVGALVVGARNGLHLRDHRKLFGGWALDEGDLLDLEAVYEAAASRPAGDVYAWERGGDW